MSINHKSLVDSAHKWVLKNASCGVAFKEVRAYTISGESPDVIGFGGWGRSVLVECKASLSDFYADKKKAFRKNPALGMGSYRYYCCPEGLINQNQLPEGWGLLYVNEKGKCRCVFNPYKGLPVNKGFSDSKCLESEHRLMYSMLRRIEVMHGINTLLESSKGYLLLRNDFNVPYPYSDLNNFDTSEL